MKFAVLALLVLLPGCSAATEWFYFDVTNPSKNQIILTPTEFKTHPSPVPVSFCGQQEEFFCVDSDVFRFAIPRKLDGRATWNYKGITYQVRHQETISVLGQPRDLIYIDQLTSREAPMRFIFSKEHGLLAFLVNDGKTRPVFVLENNCGPGAASGCKDSK